MAKTTKLAKKEEKSITKKESADLSMTNRPDFVEDSASQPMDRDEVLLPRIDVAQALSPQIDEESASFIPGLKQGMLFNTASGEILGNKIKFVSVAYQKEYLLFRDREKGGGFGGSYPTEEAALAAIEERDDDGWESVLSLSNLVMVLDDNLQQVALAYLAGTRTKLKVMRKMNTHLQMVKAPRYATVFELSTVKEEGAKGMYYNFAVRPLGWLSDLDTYNEARRIASSMKDRRFSGDHTDSDDEKTEW